VTSRPAQIKVNGAIGGEIITSAAAARCLMRFTFAVRHFAEVWYEELSDLLSVTQESGL
jgi:hypothetical protein